MICFTLPDGFHLTSETLDASGRAAQSGVNERLIGARLLIALDQNSIEEEFKSMELSGPLSSSQDEHATIERRFIRNVEDLWGFDGKIH